MSQCQNVRNDKANPSQAMLQLTTFNHGMKARGQINIETGLFLISENSQVLEFRNKARVLGTNLTTDTVCIGNVSTMFQFCRSKV